ncbi:MAG: response regulator [Elusimicrobia bacterium]|nr:response regulator [Elusimicrobiota bacterium]
MPQALLADDDFFGREISRLRLEAAGFSIFLADDGGQALAAARARTPDLIVLDAHMPGMDGTEACLALKADPATAAVPVLLLTACPPEEAESLRRSCGADACLSKPAEPRALIATALRLTAGGGA